MQQVLSWEANRFSASQEIPHISASEFRRRWITQKKAYNKKPHCSLGYLITNLLT